MSSTRRAWLVITSRGNWERLRERREWVFAGKDKFRAMRISGGDKAVVYLTSDGGVYPSAIGGILELGGELRETDDPGAFDKLYPWSVEAKPLHVPPEPIPIKPHIEELSFVGSRPNWGAPLQGHPLKEIEPEDVEYVRELIEASSGGL